MYTVNKRTTNTYIYNLSLSLGVIPDKWKTAKVTPLHKKGDRYDIHNYRPISIISVFAKLGKIIVQQIDALPS
jgi:hypothetical protein